MYHLELNKTFFNLHKKINHLNYDNIINKVQYFQNKCGCNKILVYLHTHTHTHTHTQNNNNNHHPNYDYIINKVKYFQNKCGCSKQLCKNPWSP